MVCSPPRPFPLAVAIGDGVTATVPLLWVVMICATFARPNGLFIAHFGWPRSRVAKAMRYYLMSIGLIVPLIMALIMFDNLNDREFSASLGRLCFLLICGALAVVTLSLKHAGIPLYLDKEGNGDNMVNRLLWNLMLGAPLVAMLAAAVGYLATAQALLARLETSVAIWFLLLVVYHIIRRWMLIQRRWPSTGPAIVARKFSLSAPAAKMSPFTSAARKGRWRRRSARSTSMPSVPSRCGLSAPC